MGNSRETCTFAGLSPQALLVQSTLSTVDVPVIFRAACIGVTARLQIYGVAPDLNVTHISGLEMSADDVIYRGRGNVENAETVVRPPHETPIAQ